MDGQFHHRAPTRTGLPLGERISHLDQLERVFARLAGEFPTNGRISGQLHAVREAGEVFRQVRDAARGSFPADFRDEIEEVRSIFMAAGARSVDLETWGLV